MTANLAQNHAVSFICMLNRFFFRGGGAVEERSTRVFVLSVEASSFFVMGRDTDNVPFIGVPAQMQPYFSQLDWGRLSLFRRGGYVYLELIDPKTANLLFALAIRVRRDRQALFCHPTEEHPSNMSLNMKTFFQEPGQPAIIPNRNDISNIPIREIFSLSELDNEINEEDARVILETSGADTSISIVNIGGRLP